MVGEGSVTPFLSPHGEQPGKENLKLQERRDNQLSEGLRKRGGPELRHLGQP